MKSEYVLMWIKGSSALVGFYLLCFIFKLGMEPLVSVSSPTINWILTFLIALSPVGAVFGYFVIWMFKFIWALIFGSSDEEESVTQKKVTYGACPYTGKLILNKDYEIFGTHWPAYSEAFEIKEDWSIHTLERGKVGWIDIDGAIHDNLPLLGNINPGAKYSGGNTTLHVSNNEVWDSQTRLGDIR
jgi:hypothetical protein